MLKISTSFFTFLFAFQIYASADCDRQVSDELPFCGVRAISAEGLPRDNTVPVLHLHVGQLLNSERIKQKFGSYGVQVLQSEGPRVANLYSESAGEKTCRTFARTTFVDFSDPEVKDAHARIVQEGASIGSTFSDLRFSVEKENVFIGAVDDAPEQAFVLMRTTHRPLAKHIYNLFVSKGAKRIHYATIEEFHHPDYLSAQDLTLIYGERTCEEQFVPHGSRGISDTSTDQ